MQRFALFDLDRTLIDLDTAFLTWATEFVQDHALDPTALDWLVALDHVSHAHREAFFTQVRERFHLPDPAHDLWVGYRHRMPHLVRCYPGVFDGLARLRAQGWLVGIVTNGMADNQLGKLQRTGLAGIVDGYAVSGVEGVRKPEIGLFEIAASRCGTTLAEGGWMVGDSLIADIEGGGRAGLRTVWIDRGTWPDHEHQADHVVSDITEAITLLQAQSPAAILHDTPEQGRSRSGP